MELPRLLAFAFGLYLSGALFAWGASSLARSQGLDPGHPVALLRQLLSRWLTRRAAAPTPAAPTPPPAVAAHPPEPRQPEPANGEIEALLAALGNAGVPSADAPPAPAAEPQSPSRSHPAVPAELAELRSLRAALELELAELVPLGERVHYLSRKVARLEREQQGSESTQTSALSAARDLLTDLAKEQERLYLQNRAELLRARSDLAVEKQAQRRQALEFARRFERLDRELDQLGAALVKARREEEAANSLVRSERELSARIRDLLAGFQPAQEP